MVNIALIGLGRIGQVHARAISRTPGAQLVAVVEANAEVAAQTAAEFGAEVRDLDAVLASDDVQAAIICTPTDTHADLIERFTQAGKAVFCEKPVDLSLERVEACLATVDAAEGALMIGFNRRFDPHFAALKATIDAGEIGEVEQVTLTSRDPGLPPAEYIKVSGGIFRDMTIHDFDMARHLLGEEVATVYATASALADPAVRDLNDFDTATVVLTTASGKQATIHNSRRASYGYDQRIEVHGSLGMVQAENQRPADIVIARGEGFTKPPLHDFFMTRYTAAYEAEIQAFVAALNTPGAELSPSGQDGLAALQLAEAALKSAETGQVVTL